MGTQSIYEGKRSTDFGIDRYDDLDAHEARLI